ncbi:ferredoxin [Streptomyces sp. SCA3-4]|uniref:ferredoxin n=1 Tax=Streptomyces sichuanensis TaxID=2871810 RepID=UPI001CE33517|nr:ferredoxin [Streptomyces sichuanensis]MCA6091170.1 ferredoxin [Streptomyces sichuanensis]
MKITIDRDRCVGAGQCVRAADEVFDQDDEDGCVVLLVSRPSERLRAEVRDAERFCPSGAIEIHDA